MSWKALYFIMLIHKKGNNNTKLFENSVSVIIIIIKVKVNFTLEQASKALRRSRGITILFL